MKYPSFYDEAEKIRLYDPLSEVLGSLYDGIVEVKYIDIVKFAGHSCPTVAGAYLMAQKALETLYRDSLPVRGEIKVEFGDDESDGVAGVIANVISNITGATEKSGFKGLGGKYARHSLMSFNADIDSSARFTRIDSGASVDVYYNTRAVPPASGMKTLMAKVLEGSADHEEREEFGRLWQKRVEEILCHTDRYPDLIKIL